MKYIVRPLSDRTWLRPDRARRSSEFIATFADTMAFLERELDHLGAKNIVLEVDVAEHEIRRDGQGVLTSARPATPAVRLAFDSRHGPMLHRCDSHVRGAATKMIKGEPVPKMVQDWQHNVRALALTLEALRAVDRYGAAETGEQYTGFKALPAGRAMPASHMTAEEAWSILGSFGDRPVLEQRAAGDARAQYRSAQAFAHPDRHDGDRTLWDQVEQAGRVLGVTR